MDKQPFVPPASWMLNGKPNLLKILEAQEEEMYRKIRDRRRLEQEKEREMEREKAKEREKKKTCYVPASWIRYGRVSLAAMSDSAMYPKKENEEMVLVVNGEVVREEEKYEKDEPLVVLEVGEKRERPVEQRQQEEHEMEIGWLPGDEERLFCGTIGVPPSSPLFGPKQRKKRKTKRQMKASLKELEEKKNQEQRALRNSLPKALRKDFDSKETLMESVGKLFENDGCKIAAYAKYKSKKNNTELSRFKCNQRHGKDKNISCTRMFCIEQDESGKAWLVPKLCCFTMNGNCKEKEEEEEQEKEEEENEDTNVFNIDCILSKKYGKTAEETRANYYLESAKRNLEMGKARDEASSLLPGFDIDDSFMISSSSVLTTKNGEVLFSWTTKRHHVNPDGSVYFKRHRISPNHLLKQVKILANAKDFEKRLKQEDVDYFLWWGVRGRLSRPTVYLIVYDTDPLNLQRSILYAHHGNGVMKRGDDGDSRFSHAVFAGKKYKETLLAIDAVALRNYRMMTFDAFDRDASVAPCSPFYLQFWALSPPDAQDIRTRRLGMYATLRFIERNFHFRDSFIFSPDDPLFCIYSQLPRFISLFHETDEQLYRNMMLCTLNQKGGDCSPEDIYDRHKVYFGKGEFFNVLLGFLRQKGKHVILFDTVVHFLSLFSGGTRVAQVVRSRQEKYPIAWKIVQYLWSRHHRTSKKYDWITVTFPSDFEDNADPKLVYAKEFPHYYLYQICVDDDEDLFKPYDKLTLASGLRSVEQNRNNAKEMKPAFAGRKIQKDDNGGGDDDKFFLKTKKDDLLERYENFFVRSPTEGSYNSTVVPFSLKKSDLWPLRGLFIVLQGIEHLQNVDSASIESILWPELSSKSPAVVPPPPPPAKRDITDEEIIGKLKISDPVSFAVLPHNLPICFKKGTRSENRELLYFDESLFVKNIFKGYYELETNVRNALEASILVRDKEFYSLCL